MRSLLLFSVLLVGCIQAPPEASGPDSGPDSGQPRDMGLDLSVLPDAEQPQPDLSPVADMGNDADLGDACADGVKNQDETDIDCGGSCSPCARGQDCATHDDCAEGFCIRRTCDWPASCAQYQGRNLGSGSADYTIDPDGADGPHDPLTVWCDMQADGGVGYTMRRFDEPALGSTQEAYRQRCAAAGLELIVPRSRSHALGIIAYNQGEPNLIGVYPKTDGAQRLNNWVGRCGGRDCSFYVSDRTNNNSQCGTGDEPSGDATTADALYAYDAPMGQCPLGQFNDGGDQVEQTGYVLCSTNDVGPRAYPSCLEINDAGSMQQTEWYGPNGMYTITRPGVGNVEVYCDFRDDGGGYTYKKLDPGMRVTTPQAETMCAQFGLQLFVPRTLPHLNNALNLGVDSIPPGSGDEYVRLIGVYPKMAKATCSSIPMNSDSVGCDFGTADNTPFYVHDTDQLLEPDGDNNDPLHSLVYTWDRFDAVSPIRTIEEAGTLADTSQFICIVGDKLGPP